MPVLSKQFFLQKTPEMAVDAVAGELFSPPPNSLLAGKNTGNIVDLVEKVKQQPSARE
jgi:hypothetical protein